jgi:CRP-like cAMP-binding protein
VATRHLVGHEVDFLSLLSARNRRRLLEGSTETVLRAGTIAFDPQKSGDAAFVVTRGLLRAYWSVPDGRQATVAFIHRNELAGGSFVVGHPAWYLVQVVTASTLRILNLKTVRAIAKKENDVMTAIATQLAERVRSAFRVIAVRSLGNIRERLAYDLLERACLSQLATGRLECETTQEALADSIGSSREVVSRALRDLRIARIVETSPGLIRVNEPQRLAAIVRAFVA